MGLNTVNLLKVQAVLRFGDYSSGIADDSTNDPFSDVTVIVVKDPCDDPAEFKAT